MPGICSSVRWVGFWVGLSSPGHSSTMRGAATMYRHSWGVVGRGGLVPCGSGGPPTAGGAA